MSALADLDDLLEELAIKDSATTSISNNAKTPKKIEVRDSSDYSKEWKELDALVNQYDKEKAQNKPINQPIKSNEPTKTAYFVSPKKTPMKEISKPEKQEPPPLPPRDDPINSTEVELTVKSNPPPLKSTVPTKEPEKEQKPSNSGSVIKGISSSSQTNTPNSNKKENICEKCRNPIQGEYTIALGKAWHKEHFVCSTCGKGIIGDFFDHDNAQVLNCRSCAEKTFLCTKCNNLIEGEYFISNGGKFHPHCTKINICFVCNQKIIGSEMIALERTYHQSCFKCTECGALLPPQFYSLKGNPICKNCSDKNLEPDDSIQCTKCSKKITGSYVNYKEQSFHNECFLCGKCSSTLPLDNFYVIKGKPHCQNCANS